MEQHNLVARNHFNLQRGMIYYLNNYGHLQYFHDRALKYYQNVHNNNAKKNMKKFLPLRYVVELKYDDMEKISGQLPKMVMWEPVMLERILDDFASKIVLDAFTICNKSAQNQVATENSVPFLDKSLIQIAIRLSGVPDMYFIKNGQPFAKGIRSVKGVITAHTATQKYTRTSVWACPEKCDYNYISRGLPAGAPKCDICLTSMAELAQYRDTGDIMKCEIVPIEAFEPDKRHDKVYRSWIVLLSDELVKNIHIGHLYVVTGVFQFSKQQIKAWNVAEVIEQPLEFDTEILKQIKISKSQYDPTQRDMRYSEADTSSKFSDGRNLPCKNLITDRKGDPGVFVDPKIDNGNNKDGLIEQKYFERRLCTTGIINQSNANKSARANLKNDKNNLFSNEDHDSSLQNDESNYKERPVTGKNDPEKTGMSKDDNLNRKSGPGMFLFGNDDLDDLDEWLSSNFTKDDIELLPRTVNNNNSNIPNAKESQMIQNNPNASVGSVSDYDKFQEGIFKTPSQQATHSTLKDIFNEKLIGSGSKTKDSENIDSRYFSKNKNDCKKSDGYGDAIQNASYDLNLSEFNDDEFLKPNACFSNKFGNKRSFDDVHTPGIRKIDNFADERTYLKEISLPNAANASKENESKQNNYFHPLNNQMIPATKERNCNNEVNVYAERGKIKQMTETIQNKNNRTGLLSKYRYVKRPKNHKEDQMVKNVSQTAKVPEIVLENRNEDKIKTEIVSQIVRDFNHDQNQEEYLSQMLFSQKADNLDCCENKQHETELLPNYDSNLRETLEDPPKNYFKSNASQRTPDQWNDTQTSMHFSQSQGRDYSEQFNHDELQIESVDELYDHFKKCPYTFVQILANKLGGNAAPLNNFTCLKLGLLLSLASITTISNEQPFHVLALGEDSLTADKLIHKFGSYAKRIVISTDWTTGGSMKKGSWLEGGPMVLARGGVCVLGDWNRYTTKNNAVASALESGLVKINKSEPTEEMCVRDFPLQSALWTYWRPPSKIKDKPLYLAVLNMFGLCLPCESTETEENEEMLDHCINLMMGIKAPDILDNIKISDDEIRTYLNKVTRIKVRIGAEAKELIQSYFVATRRVRPDCVPLSALKCITRLSEAHCRLRQQNVVSKQDAVAAIWICETGLCHLWGESIIASPKPEPVKRLSEISKFMYVFERWLQYYISSVM